MGTMIEKRFLKIRFSLSCFSVSKTLKKRVKGREVMPEEEEVSIDERVGRRMFDTKKR